MNLELVPISLAVVAIVAFIAVLIPFFLRRVVSTNEVHIVQSGGNTISYGKDKPSGNAYYEWPHWIPFIGITKVELPVSVFDLTLEAYEAYDKERVPFVVDVTAFFRISDSNLAAQRISSFEELRNQLEIITKGAVRTVLASHEVNEIMLKRSEFGAKFTEEVAEQLTSWGVESVKNIELMDVRDSSHENVIKNIMSKRKSFIEMESRVEVAENNKKAQVAEIERAKEVIIQRQEAEQEVGQRTAQTEMEVGIAKERAAQTIKEQQKITRGKEMDVLQVESIRKSEINRDTQVIQADQEKQTTVIKAQGSKERTVLEAQGLLQSNTMAAEAIKIQGQAKAEAEKAIQLAPVEAQIVLAKEIGTNKEYQNYLLSNRKIEADQVIGEKQAEALAQADLKIIANSSEVSGGIKKLTEVFSSKGGTELAGMAEAFAQSEIGKNIFGKILNGEKNDKL